jgi:excisionase family DNA binding protein
MAEEEFFSLRDVADRLKVSEQTVRRWVKSGRLKAYKPGLEYRIQASDLQGFLESRTPKAEAPSPSPPELSEEERRMLELAAVEWARMAPRVRDFEDLTPSERREVFEAAWNLFKKLVAAFDLGYGAAADPLTHVSIAVDRMIAFYELQHERGSAEGDLYDLEEYRRRMRGVA